MADKSRWPKGGSPAAMHNPRAYYSPRLEDYKGKGEKALFHNDTADRYDALSQTERFKADPRVAISAPCIAYAVAAGDNDPARIAAALSTVLTVQGLVPFTTAEVAKLMALPAPEAEEAEEENE